MSVNTLSRTRIFRADPALDDDVTEAARRSGVKVSEFLRSTLRTAVSTPPVLSRPYGPHAHVPADSVSVVWPEVCHFIEAACARPGCDETADSLRALCERQQAMLLLLLDEAGKPAAAGVFQLRDYEDGTRSCWILAMGGRQIIPWRGWLDVVETRARVAECATIEFVGRAGWRRALPHYVAERCDAGWHFSRTIGH